LCPGSVDCEILMMKDIQTRHSHCFVYSRRHSARPLPVLQSGQRVKVKLDGEMGWTTSAKVVDKAPEPRCHYVQGLLQQGTVPAEAPVSPMASSLPSPRSAPQRTLGGREIDFLFDSETILQNNKCLQWK
ncbi:hypothetical protein GOODEAATRI_025882, partial [Goodea atripinnis]